MALDRKPNKWIAALLGFFLQPLGMLYVGRVGLAAAYYGTEIAISLADFFLAGRFSVRGNGFAFMHLSVYVACAIHAHRIASCWPEGKPRRWYSRWYVLVLLFAAFMTLAIIVRAFYFEPFRVPAGGMYPSIKTGTFIVVGKQGFGHYETFGLTIMRTAPTRQPARGDIVVFEHPGKPWQDYMKRVVGLPGDTIEYKGKKLIVNGEQATGALVSRGDEFEFYEERLGGAVYEVAIQAGGQVDNMEIVVPAGELFVLGDNRDNSNDSRYMGTIPMENLVGKVVYVIR